MGSGTVVAPASEQQEASAEAKNWGKQWGIEEGKEYEEVQWPVDLGELPQAVVASAVVNAAVTFPVDTGLGWDGLHPRALVRLSDATFKWLAAVMHQAEVSGNWDAAVHLIIIVLLPKPDGGRRPMDYCPFCRGFGCEFVVS